VNNDLLTTSAFSQKKLPAAPFFHPFSPAAYFFAKSNLVVGLFDFTVFFSLPIH